jgi:hypothetical protein
MRWACVALAACSFKVDRLPLGGADGPIATGDAGRPTADAPFGTPDAHAFDAPRARPDAFRADAPIPDAALPDARPPDCSATTPGLVACWEFEGNGNDSHGGLHDATLSSESFAAGQTGMGLVSTPPDSRAFVAAAADFQAITDAITIEAWAKTTVVPTIMGTREGVFDDDGSYGIFFYPVGTDPGGMIRCSVAGVGNLFAGAVVADTPVHVACVYDSATGVLTEYLDGVSAGTLTVAAGTKITPTNHTMEIGGNAECLTAPCTDVFSGTIDNLRVWNVARTPAEILGDATE